MIKSIGEKRTTTCHRDVCTRTDGRSDGRQTLVRGCMPPPRYGERAERRRDIERARPGTTWSPPLSKTLALCHVATHNEAARWASVILAPELVFCLPENSLLCRAASPFAPAVLLALSYMIFAFGIKTLNVLNGRMDLLLTRTV